ncbi:WD40 repeat-like protein [Epithele typhae]|uniref:WD40 repeat-like protein n=1 Tax=Epithele typhae TaxID=378194 RepID=UPI0020077E2B|nr:WD40 repeat-like protein [Epithele typhae]KAH9920834.1 WD40 repeat-like protein [Epithele typhae]
MARYTAQLLALFAALLPLILSVVSSPFPVATPFPGVSTQSVRRTDQPTFPSDNPSCPICEASYSSISSCAQAAPVLENFTLILFNPSAFIDIIQCACTDTFQSAYPQCVDCFIQTNQTQFLDADANELPSIVSGMRSVCALASTLLGGVASADGEVPSSTTTSTAPTSATTGDTQKPIMDDPANPFVCRTPLPPRKRGAPGAVTPNLFSATKRRRMSLSDEREREFEIGLQAETSYNAKVDVSDRFISAPKEIAVPLQATPRTQRIARFFGLADDRILQYTDTNSEPSKKNQNHLKRHRFNFRQLTQTKPALSPASAASNLGSRRQFVLALDGPGIPSDLFAYPMSWSARNAIAVACGLDVYYQELSTRKITHLLKLPPRPRGRLVSIAWARQSPEVLAAGTGAGELHLWDADVGEATAKWTEREDADVGGLSWTGDVLAYGLGDGAVVLRDRRESEAAAPVARLDLHRDKVHGLAWRDDGMYLASADHAGVVQVWDARASKALTADGRLGSKLKHRAPVKALAWCPWKPELLATGTMYPDGRIRVWNTKGTLGTAPPVHMLALNTSVTSLVWSPHCKELLSTHGISWLPRGGAHDSCPDLPSSIFSGPGSSAGSSSTGAGSNARGRGGGGGGRQRPISARTSYTNALAVHAYPSLKRVLSVGAHTGPIGHACLSPDGTSVFTICPSEEAMKMWAVWGTRERAEQRESVFDKCLIR